MIGFRCKSVNLSASLAVSVSLLLAACAQPVVKDEPRETVSSPAPVKPETDSEGLSVQPEPQQEQLTAPLLYGVLLGEIAGQRGQLDVSGASYLEAARQSNDPRIAERALKISVYAKKPQLALQAARRWVELAPENLEARQSLAVLALRTNNQQEALEQFEYLLQQNQDDGSDPYQSLLALLAREPNQERALKIMEQLVALRPHDPEAHFAYARLAVHAKNQPLAEQEVERSLQLRPDWTQALILQAQIRLEQGRGELARQQLYAALQRKPKDADLRLAYARLLVDLDDFDAARAEYRTLLKQQPENGQVVYSLALLALEANQLKEAQVFFGKLVALDYQTQQAYYYLGAIAEEQNNRSRALQWYQKVEKEGERWIEVQIRIARLEAQGGDVEVARKRLRKLRLGQPAQAQRLFLVEGDLLTQLGRHEEAYNLYSQYLETQPDDTEILYARALTAENLDRLDEAERDFRKVLQQDPDNARTLNALGYTLADRTERYQEALIYVQKAYTQTPDDPAVIDSLGWVLYRLGRLQEARDHLQKAYDMTADGEIGAHLGEVMWTMGDKDAARAVWDKARKDAPDNAVLEETLRRFSH